VVDLSPPLSQSMLRGSSNTAFAHSGVFESCTSVGRVDPILFADGQPMKAKIAV
jgi:hypothetical protein